MEKHCFDINKVYQKIAGKNKANLIFIDIYLYITGKL